MTTHPSLSSASAYPSRSHWLRFGHQRAFVSYRRDMLLAAAAIPTTSPSWRIVGSWTHSSFTSASSHSSRFPGLAPTHPRTTALLFSRLQQGRDPPLHPLRPFPSRTLFAIPSQLSSLHCLLWSASQHSPFPSIRSSPLTGLEYSPLCGHGVVVSSYLRRSLCFASNLKAPSQNPDILSLSFLYHVESDLD